MKADSSAKSGAIARGAVRPVDVAVARREIQPPLHGFVRPVDKWTDEAGMEASVDKASLRVQAPRHLAGYRGEVLQVV